MIPFRPVHRELLIQARRVFRAGSATPARSMFNEKRQGGTQRLGHAKKLIEIARVASRESTRA